MRAQPVAASQNRRIVAGLPFVDDAVAHCAEQRWPQEDPREDLSHDARLPDP